MPDDRFLAPDPELGLDPGSLVLQVGNPVDISVFKLSVNELDAFRSRIFKVRHYALAGKHLCCRHSAGDILPAASPDTPDQCVEFLLCAGISCHDLRL